MKSIFQCPSWLSRARLCSPLAGRRHFLKGAAAALFATLLGAASLAQAASADGEDNPPRWVGTWAASPQAADPPAATLMDQTVRQIVRTSVAGNRVRVRLSNEFGTTPLVVGAATVARRDTGSNIVAGSDRALSFGGQRGITLAPGAPALSDAIDFEVPAVGDLVISLYLPQASVPRTVHSLASATTYISTQGDYSSAVVMPTASAPQSWFFLTGVTVNATRRSAAIVALGDSITDGYASTLDANRRWPNLLADRLQANARTTHLAVLNHGISGNRTNFDLVGPNVQARLDRDVLAAPGARFVILLAGINNIGIPGAFGLPDQATSAQDIIAGHQQVIARTRERGLKIFGATLTPFEGTIFPGYYTLEGEAKRQAVNQWIRTSGAFDAVIDFDMALRDPAQPARLLPAYDSGDHLHPNDAGYQAMANFIDLRLFRRAGD